MNDSVKRLYILHSEKILNQILPNLAFLNLKKELKAYFKRNPILGSRDRRFIQDIIYGYFRWKLLIDRLPLNHRIPLVILLEGESNVDWNQFFYKDYAISQEFTAKFNSEENSTADKISFLNCYYETELKLPHILPHFVREKIKCHSEEAFYNALQKRALISVWTKFPLAHDEEKNARTHPFLPNSYFFPTNSKIKQMKSFLDGSMEIQDAASQMIVHACQVKKGESLWDACCGAGGKTLHLSYLLGKNAKIDASDLRDYKFRELKERAKRLTISNIHCFKHDLEKDINPKKYDCVLLDAPCSGSGTWRRHPQLKFQIDAEKLERLQSLQKIFLYHASKSVKVMGRLVYASCSLFEEENEFIVQEFLEKHENFKIIEQKNPLNSLKSNGLIRSSIENGFEDGVFVTMMKRIR